MPFIAPFIPAIIGAGASIGGSLLGGRGNKQSQEGKLLSQMSLKNLGQAGDYFSGVMKNPAEATATGASDLGKQFQQGINYNARHYSRSGATGMANAEAPFKLASAARGQQILAQMGAADKLGELGLGAGRIGLGQQGIDLERTQQNRQFWSGIGESIGGLLTQPTALGKGSILGRIFGPKGSSIQGNQPGGYQGTQVGLPSQTIPRGLANDLGEP